MKMHGRRWIRAASAVVLALTLGMTPVGLSAPAAEDAISIQAARQVMTEFLRAFNGRDVDALAATLMYPHVRIAAGGLVVFPDSEAFIAATDMQAFAQRFDWNHSEWDAIDVVQSGPGKVHFKVQFSRFDARGQRNATFNSLYVVQQVDGRWGIRARSSFAP